MRKRHTQPVVRGLPASEWFQVFKRAKVEIERLESAKSTQARATIIGNFLARMVDREVPIELDGRAGRATLRSTSGRSGKRLYYFDVVFDDDQGVFDDRRPEGSQPAGGKIITHEERSRKDPRKPVAESRTSPIDRGPASGVVPAGNDEVW